MSSQIKRYIEQGQEVFRIQELLLPWRLGSTTLPARGCVHHPRTLWPPWFRNFYGILIMLLLLFSHSVVSHSLRPHGQKHSRLPCPSLSPETCSNSSPLSWWCHTMISSSVTPFSSYPQSFPASGSFPTSQLFTSGSQSIGASASASVLPMDIQDWFPSGLTTALIFLQDHNS